MRRLIMGIIVASGIFTASLAFAPATSALDIACQSENSGQCNLIKPKTSLTSNIWGIISLALTILGGIAVIVIIIAGIMYATSAGDSSKLTAAKNTIFYAVLGLVIALLAAAIISFVNGFFE